MNSKFPRIRVMGERAILVEFETEISESILQKVLFLKKKIEDHYHKVNVEVINTYNSLLVYYDHTIDNVYNEVLALEDLFQGTKITKKSYPQLYNIPVCYDAELGLDLKLLSKENNLSLEQIIGLHTHPFYTVFFIGFLPGFLYLGGLDKKLQISRKIQPRMLVQKGAVGIGENQTGIYPKSSPGGWQIIGNSPVPLFDKNRLPPCEILAGDKVKFYQVSKSEFEKISEEIKQGKFQFKKTNYEG